MLDASIIVVTRNRKEMAARTLTSALAQEGNIEVILVDDASTDGTVPFIREKFPTVRVIAGDRQEGYIVLRSRAARAAQGPVVFSIDDDAEYADPHTVRDALTFFQNPRIGAVMIPHQNSTLEGQVTWSAPIAPDDGVIYAVASFIGTAYAVRRDIFNALGGFQDFLFHWGEESEYSQRLLNAGYFIAAGCKYQIRHYQKWTGKYSRSTLAYLYRNRFLNVWFNVPTLLIIPGLLFQVLHALKMTIKKPNERLVALEGTLYGIGAAIKGWRLRHPIRLDAYRLWLKLRKNKFTPLTQVVDLLPLKPVNP